VLQALSNSLLSIDHRTTFPKAGALMASFNTVMPLGAWASGNLMIASQGAVLPLYCVKGGRPADLNSFCKKFS
jgi:hypothetical protein